MTITAVCVHVHMSDNKGTLCDTENSWLLLDVDKRETLRDDKSGLRAYGEERNTSETTIFTPHNRHVAQLKTDFRTALSKCSDFH